MTTKTKLDKLTHDALAQLWINNYPNTVWDGQNFWRYAQTHWQQIPYGAVSAEVYRVCVGAKEYGVNPTNGITKSVLGMAQDEVYIYPDVFDSDPDKLTVQNGILCLASRVLVPHSPDHYNTSVLPYAYDPQALAKDWQYYLLTTLKPDVIAFLQEFAGYCLTTDTSHETAIWLCGPRGSGKSTFIHGLQTMLGKRAGMLGLAELGSRFALAEVPGKTLLIATEQPASTVAATSIVNRLISGEPVKSEQKFMRAIEIIPRAKICWAMNDLPAITSANDGIFRRVHITQFDERPEASIDKGLKDRIALQGDGILNWALDGLTRLQARGKFSPPQSVVDSTREYHDNSDMAAMFIAECCTVDANQRIKSSALFMHYTQWRKDHGMFKPVTIVEAATDWKRLGFPNFKSNGVIFYKGLTITA